jgi:hypothetical protein
MNSTEKEKSSAQIKFLELWNNYPNQDPCVNQRTGKKAYDDQCAIRLGMALQKSGVDFSSFPGPRCEFGPRETGMVLRARELAEWLTSKPFKGCPKAVILDGKAFPQAVMSRTGVIFFHGYWLRDGEKFPTGDHIDLWNVRTLTPSWSSFMRFRVGISRFPNILSGGNYYSNLSDSRIIKFWPIA